MEVKNLLISNDFKVIKSNETPYSAFFIQEHILKTIQQYVLPNKKRNMAFESSRDAILIICNHQNPSGTIESTSTLFLYTIIEKELDGYNIMFTNWLDWINTIGSSMEQSHEVLNGIKKVNIKKPLWTKTSPASVLKALYPLIYFTPKKLQNKVNGYNLFETVSSMDPRNADLNKDYSRNFYSKVGTSLKQDFNIYDYQTTKSNLVDKLTVSLPKIGTVLLKSELSNPVNSILIKRNLALDNLIKLSLNQRK